MFKSVFSLFAFVFSLNCISAQGTVDIDSLAIYFSKLQPVEGTNSYCTDVMMDKSNYMLSFQFSISYDHSVLDFSNCEVSGELPGYRCADLVEANDSTLITNWIDGDQTPNEYDDGLKLFTLCFESVTGQCPDPSSMLGQINRMPMVIEILFGDPNDLSVTLLAEEVDVFPLTFDGCDVVSSSDDILIDDRLVLSPNPARNTLNWQIESEYKIEAISIIHQTGAVVKRFSKIDNSLDIEQLNPGIYYLELRDRRGHTRHAKFVKI